MRRLFASCTFALVASLTLGQGGKPEQETASSTAEVFEYDHIDYFQEGRAAMEVSGKHGFIDNHGREIVPPRYDEVLSFQEDLAAVRVNGKWGFIDQEGRVVIPHNYDLVRGFSEELAAVKMGGKWGFIDKTGRIIIPPTFERVYDFKQRLARFSTGSVFAKHGYIDRSGAVVIPPKYKDALDFSEGLAAVKIGVKWGYIDRSGHEVIRPEYARANNFVKGRAAVETSPDGKWLLINPEQRMLKSFASDSAGRAIEYIGEFRDGFAKTTINPFAVAMRAGTMPGTAAPPSTYGLIGESGEPVMFSPFSDVLHVSDGFAVVRSREGVGLFELRRTSGLRYSSTLIPSKFAHVTNLNDAGFAFAKTAPRQWIKFDFSARRNFALGIAHLRAGDHAKAREFFEVSAGLGSIPAMGHLGFLYLQGLGVEQNDALAEKWLFQDAKAGEASSMVNLATLLIRLRRNEEGIAWLQKAASLGHPRAKLALEQIERGTLPAAQESSHDR